MKRFLALLPLVLLLIAVGAGIAIAVEHWVLPMLHAPADEVAAKGADKGGGSAGGEDKPAVALVRTTAAEKATLHPAIQGFGTVALKPSTAITVSWPLDIVVRRVLVVPGQSVAKGAPLLEAEPTPDAALQLSLARQAVEAARAALETARARLAISLGTKLEVQAAEAIANEAQRRLERLSTGQLPGDGMVRAGADGIVQMVRAQAGSVVPAGTPLADLTPQGGVVAQIGLEPAMASRIAAGTRVHLRAVEPADDPGFDGVISLINPAVNPATRLIDVTVDLPDRSNLPAGLAIEARIELPALEAVTVPRAAVLPGDEAEVVFVVKDGKAVKRAVKIGVRERERVQVLEGVASGEPVVVLGQGQLEDGMPVRVEGEH